MHPKEVTRFGGKAFLRIYKVRNRYPAGYTFPARQVGVLSVCVLLRTPKRIGPHYLYAYP